MSITYTVEISNREIEKITDFTEEIFKAVIKLGQVIVSERLERLDDELMQSFRIF